MGGFIKMKEGRMRVAVMMSVYNGGQYLDEQLASIFSQSVGVENIGLFIRDDGSTDGSREIIERWGRKMSIHYERGDNLGPARSFWRLMQNSRISADYYALADQDDIWDGTKLERAVSVIENVEKKIQNAEELLLYYSNARLVDARGRDLQATEITDDQEITVARILAGFPAIGCTMVFNRGVKRLLEESQIRIIEMHDKTLALMVQTLGQIIYDPLPTMRYRQHDRNVVGRRFEDHGGHFLKRMSSAGVRWFRNRKICPSKQAAELLEHYGDYMSDADRKTLIDFSTYRKRLKAAKSLWENREVATLPSAVRRSFKMRLILRLL